MAGLKQPRDDRERDERYPQLVELAPDAILVHDDGRIVLANTAAVRLAGAIDRAQLLGLPVAWFLDPPYLKAVQAQLTDLVSPAQLALPVRDTFHRLDGAEVPVEVRAVAFLDRGHPAAHLVIRDITDRLAAEQTAREVTERLQQAQRMEVVGTLAGGVAHEINNQMTGVLGFTDFLLRSLEPDDPKRPDLLAIRYAAQHSVDITRQLLAFGQRLLLRPAILELNRLVAGTESALRQVLTPSITLRMILGETVERVRIDQAHLEKALITLVLNACDAMPEGGQLTIETTTVIVADNPSPGTSGEAVPAGTYARLIVRDTGNGMDAPILARIFEPFFTTKDVGEGTGLGLASVYGVVKQSGGLIRVESKPGRGTTFTLDFPQIVGALLPVARSNHAGPSYNSRPCYQ